MPDKTKQSVFLTGIIGSRGACVARAYVFRKRIEVKRTSIEESLIEKEIERLEAAIKMTNQDILNSRAKAQEQHGEKYAAIFDSHLLMLEDPQFKPKMIQKLKSEKVNVESIVRDTVDQIHAMFSAIEDPYLRERAIDIKDVGDRLLRNLMGLEGPAAEIGNEPYVLIAHDVTPSEILDFSKGKLMGVCLDSGGATSHVAILSDALGIPSVFGLTNLSLIARTGDLVLIDTRKECRVIINPEEIVVKELQSSLKSEKKLAEISNITADGFKLSIGVNIARTEELSLLAKLKIKRIGLFRSEFLFMESMDLPSEKFQKEVYSKVVKAAPDMAVLRTVDIGSDKPLKYLPFPHEENPAMGFRSTRFLLSRPDVLEPQLRAMMQAAANGNVRIIFPMVTVENELAAIDNIYKKVAAELKIENPPEWGIMVEVPSTVFMLDKVSCYTRYISLGTNDLLQFFYAIDRTNEKLAGLANHTCLPFLRLIYQCVDKAKKLGIKVGVCGEMASDPIGFIALIGAGVEELSIRPSVANLIGAMIPLIDRQKLMQFMQELVKSGINNNISKEILNEFPQFSEFFS
ncbi:MAG: phosphoenolpyruvate--protein phosphotransferase [Candidatus Rifleibacteriota bacterium]